MMNRVSVVLLNYNGHFETVPCLESLLKSDYPLKEIVIVDNNSSDDSVEYLQDWFSGKTDYNYQFDPECFPLEIKPISYSLYINSAVEIKLVRRPLVNDSNVNITLIQNYSNDGFSAGNNIGIRYLLTRNAEIIWLLNNDTIVKKDTLSEMMKIYDSSEYKKVIIGSCLYYNHKRDEIQAFGGGCVNFITGRAYSVKKQGQIDYITGASLLIPSFGFNEIGYLDEKYFMYWEDTDFSVRAKKLKWKIKVAGNSIVYHKHNASTEKENLKINYFRDISTARGSLRFFFKHAGIFAVLPICCRMSTAFIKRIKKFSFAGFFSIIFRVLIRNSGKS